MTARVYLSGPISGLTYEEAAGWRRWVVGHLAPGIVGIDPLRGKTGLKERLGGRRLGFWGEYADLPNCLPAEILARDRYDVMHSDAMLLKVDGPRIMSGGSLIEIGWADASRVPIVVAGTLSLEHPFLDELAAWKVLTLGEAVNILNSLLAPYSGESVWRW